MSAELRVRHQMLCEVWDAAVRVGEMRGDADSHEIRTPTDVLCAYCGTPLVRFSGYRERVLITALVGDPVNGRQLVDIEDIPDHLDILSCSKCQCNFTAPRGERL